MSGFAGPWAVVESSVGCWVLISSLLCAPIIGVTVISIMSVVVTSVGATCVVFRSWALVSMFLVVADSA